MHCLYGGHCLRVRVRVPAPVDVRVGVCVSNRCVWVPDLSGIRNYSPTNLISARNRVAYPRRKTSCEEQSFKNRRQIISDTSI